MTPFTECVMVGILLGLPHKTTVHYITIPYGDVAYVSFPTELAKIVGYPTDDLQTVEFDRPTYRKKPCAKGRLFADWHGGVW